MDLSLHFLHPGSYNTLQYKFQYQCPSQEMGIVRIFCGMCYFFSPVSSYCRTQFSCEFHGSRKICKLLIQTKETCTKHHNIMCSSLTMHLQLYFLGSASGFYFIYDFCLYNNMSSEMAYFLRYIPLFVGVLTSTFIIISETGLGRMSASSILHK